MLPRESAFFDIMVAKRFRTSNTHRNRHNYTYSFEPKWDWSSNYAEAGEIFQYFSDFANKYDLRKYISFRHEVVGARWDEDATEWVVDVREGGPEGRITRRRADFLINASGVLNKWKWPDVAGLDSFKGPKIHSANWDDSVDLKGKRVGLIGNGYASTLWMN